MKKFQNYLRQISKINPSDEYRDRAKMRLFQNIMRSNESWFSSLSGKVKSPAPSAEMKFSFLNRLLEKEKSFRHRSWLSRFAFAGVGALASVFVVVSSFFLFSSSISAGEKTYLKSALGVVDISTNGSDFYPAEQEQILSNNTSVRTGDLSSASIIFFEDSILRLDENTEIKIQKLLPHPLVNEVGSVSIELSFGRVWLKSLSEQNDYAGFELHSGDTVLIPDHATLDVERTGNLTSVRVFERSAKVSYRGERERKTVSLIANRQTKTNLLGISDVEKIPTLDLIDEWILENVNLDKVSIEQFLEREIAVHKNTLEQFKDDVSLALKPQSGEKYLQIAERDFAKAIVALRSDEDATELLDSFSLNLTRAIEANVSLRSLIEIKLQKLQKLFQSILPSDSLYSAKLIIKKEIERVAIKPEFTKEKLIKETLWEVHDLTDSNDAALASQQLKVFREQIGELDNSSNNPTEQAEILEQKTEELEILSDLQEENVLAANELVVEIENEIISDVIEAADISSGLIRPGFPGSEKHETVDDLILRLEKYESERGQENTMRDILNNIPDTPASLSDLAELKSRVPVNLRRIVAEKIIKIVNLEKQRVLLEAH